jgi:hypothetical protein
MTVYVIGWLLVLAAALPALAPKIETGVTLTAGLLMVALAGLSMALDFGAHRRDLLLWAGMVLVLAGAFLQRRHAWGRLARQEASRHF